MGAIIKNLAATDALSAWLAARLFAPILVAFRSMPRFYGTLAAYLPCAPAKLKHTVPLFIRSGTSSRS